MRKKVLVALCLIAAVSIFLTIREQGKEAFGGILKPVESVRSDLSPQADGVGVMPAGPSVPQTSQSDYKQLVNRVRVRVNGAMDESERRASRY